MKTKEDKDHLVCCDCCGELFDPYELTMGVDNNNFGQFFCSNCLNKILSNPETYGF